MDKQRNIQNQSDFDKIAQFNPAIHHRRSIRFKGYDYSQPGLYFVTVCVNVGADLRVCPDPRVCPDRPYLFGNVVDGEMILNDAGQMVEKWCMELSQKFLDVELDTFIIMPNHFHAIIGVRADLDVCAAKHGMDLGEPGANLGEPGANLGEPGANLGEHIGSPLHAVVQWFKTMTTNEYIRGVKTLGGQRFYKKLWQRNYYEHIIRNKQSYQHIANYIINNPTNWKDDQFYME